MHTRMYVLIQNQRKMWNAFLSCSLFHSLKKGILAEPELPISSRLSSQPAHRLRLSLSLITGAVGTLCLAF